MTADESRELTHQSAPHAGTSRGWSVFAETTWVWNAWCDGESRGGGAGSRGGAELLARAALDELQDTARRRAVRRAG